MARHYPCRSGLSSGCPTHRTPNWQACEALRTAVEEQRFRHTGQHAFVDGIARGRVKRTDRGWMFDRNASSKLRVDISPLIAAAMALDVAQNELDVASATAVHVY